MVHGATVGPLIQMRRRHELSKLLSSPSMLSRELSDLGPRMLSLFGLLLTRCLCKFLMFPKLLRKVVFNSMKVGLSQSLLIARRRQICPKPRRFIFTVL